MVVTRTCIGIWDILTGKLKTKLAESVLGAIVTHALVTGYSLTDQLNILPIKPKYSKIRSNSVANSFDSPFHCTRDCFEILIASEQFYAQWNGLYV